MKIIVNANNIHTGGGKAILDDFINAAKKSNYNFIFFLDTRYKLDSNSKNITFIKENRYKRIFSTFKIKKIESTTDIIIYFGNIPPVIKHKAKTILLLSNRFLLDNMPLKGFSFFSRFQKFTQKIIFNFFNKNVDKIIVQSQTMLDLLKKNKNLYNKSYIKPFKNNENLKNKNKNNNSNNIFIYVASELNFKNHENLVLAWCHLAENQIRPKLYLTLNNSYPKMKMIENYIKEFNLNITNFGDLNRNELLQLYLKSDILIYPSFFESWGIPLLEAKNLGLKIIASELDYVRDIVDPSETFDPNSPRSIARAVKRILNIEDKKSEIISASNFIEYILNK